MVVLVLVVLLQQQVWAQEKKAPVLAPPKQLQALRITESIKIDGSLDEAVWQQAEIATDFIQNRPNPGPKEVHPTQVRILYDDDAIYVGAIMHDVSQDSIFKEMGKRDDLGNTDFFGVFFDTYNDQINGFGFFTTPAGVQLDARYSSNGEDFSWNAVWESNATLQGNTWVAEMRIPYSAIRFSNKPEQLWGLNFMRNRQSTRKGYFWNHVDPAINGFVNQWGQLTGIKNVEAPLRLSLTPYVSGYAEKYPHQNGDGSTSYKDNFNFSGGMDVKYGINDAFTLDMTLIPDFSQVQSDNQVLNLSPFEVQFNENRPFFMEGTELFNKGDFLYSRRIGGRPINYLNASEEEKLGNTIVENPRETKMLNGTKISGRTQSGLGIGIFNAVVGRQYATVEDSEGNQFRKETQPLTNYNIAVFDQSLKNNSYVTLVNTNVMRQGSTYDANLTGLLFRLATKGNKYALNGKAALSQKYYTSDTRLGHMYSLGAGKVSGNFQYSFTHSMKSDTYDPNDMGINFIRNTVDEDLNLRYNFYQPFWKLLNMNTQLGATYSRRYKPDTFQNLVVYGRVSGTFKNFLSVGVFSNLEPVVTYDFFEPRVEGRYYAYPTNSSIGGWVSSDYRKKLALDVELNYRTFNEHERRSLDVFVAPRYRVNDKLSFTYSYSRNIRQDDMGFAHHVAKGERAGMEERVIFGLRDVNTVTNALTGSYIFNNRMSLSLRARHYWSKAEYNRFFQLGDKGELLSDTYPHGGYFADGKQPNHNINFNTFNIDMVYSWWFAPGSEISIVWKNAILNDQAEIIPRYYDNFTRTITGPQTNSLSIKVLYFIDYQVLKKRFSKS
ncbi:Carbohydrate family 9 binding domain-like [Pontibacter indicus]|uniref:Carbohydrate family 9 binding domain-like n=2 Tax=Pontibacter indicus TaxID=1317125 RepID=A0A1R3XF49_9BACT|nr:Carbohydrate family 9 binding domain-like [Pontibacter indicus]